MMSPSTSLALRVAAFSAVVVVVVVVVTGETGIAVERAFVEWLLLMLLELLSVVVVVVVALKREMSPPAAKSMRWWEAAPVVVDGIVSGNTSIGVLSSSSAPASNDESWEWCLAEADVKGTCS